MVDWQESNPRIREYYRQKIDHLESQREQLLQRLRVINNLVRNRCDPKSPTLFSVASMRCALELEDVPNLDPSDEIQWVSCATQIREIESEIIYICELILACVCPEGNKEMKIRTLKEYLRRDVHATYVAEAVGCHEVYARNFCWDGDGAVREKEYAKNRRKQQADPVKRNQILQRDSNTCVWCEESPTQSVVHHVIPVSQGGTNRLGNLALLCKSCHSEAHQGNGHGGVSYEGADEFWERSRYSTPPSPPGNS